MALIAILISLVVERLLGSMEELRRFDWFDLYSRWAAQRLMKVKGLNGPVGTLLLLLPLIAPVVEAAPKSMVILSQGSVEEAVSSRRKSVVVPPAMV